MNGREKAVSNGEIRNTKDYKLPNIVEPGFVAPDGGWGWMVVIATGFSNFFTLSLTLSYGLIFRGRLEQLGINTSQNTTIININLAVVSCIGLANGPLFRKYSCRQVACVGALVCALSVCVLSFMETFYGILIVYSILYAAGNSLAMSSCALALNIYFKTKRRMAVGLAWTYTGLGTTLIPQLVTLLLSTYDVSGTILIFGGITLNAVACALLLQPVSTHVRKEEAEAEYGIKKNGKETSSILTNGTGKTLSIDNIRQRSKLTSNAAVNHSSQTFGSQYLYYNDEEKRAMGLDVGSSMISRANDGWFSKLNSSNPSLASNKTVKKQESRQTINQPMSEVSNGQSSLAASINQSCENIISDQGRETDDYQMLSEDDKATESFLGQHSSKSVEKTNKVETEKSGYMQSLKAVALFFDLYLLQDPVYVNLMLGITFANFADLNFFILMPFLLSDIGLRMTDVANILSIISIVDVITRLIVPVIATRIGWENRTFFIIAMIFTSIGRILIAHVKTYNFLMATAVFIGFGKAFRTVFVALVIPTHVPLETLPAASGLQLATSGIVCLTLGPVIGWITDISGNYMITLHYLNVFVYVVIISWVLELCYCSITKKKLEQSKEMLA